MEKSYFKIIGITITALVFVSSCANTKIVSSWKMPNKEVKIDQLRKVLVVALFDKQTTMRKAEDEMVSYLQGSGVASYNYLSDNYNTKDEVALHNKLKKDSFDGAITMRLVDVEQETVYTPSNVQYYPSYNRTFSGYFIRNYGYSYTPGYYTNTQNYIVETNIYSIKENKIIWTGITKSTKPNGVNKMTDEIVAVIYKKLKVEKFIY